MSNGMIGWIGGTCKHCHNKVVKGKGGWRRLLGVPLSLKRLYYCTANTEHEPL